MRANDEWLDYWDEVLFPVMRNNICRLLTSQGIGGDDIGFFIGDKLVRVRINQYYKECIPEDSLSTEFFKLKKDVLLVDIDRETWSIKSVTNIH
tara:strand:+ start:1039 stop:1320 length:282 start_codon:yes stop_codon:yes gene_type:complete